MNTLLRQWGAAAPSAVIGFELASKPLDAEFVAEAVRPIVPEHLVGGAFLLLRLAATDQAGVNVALSSVQQLAQVIRVCLAIDRATLADVDSGTLRSRNVGLLLDAVDAETPPSAIIHQGIEAVRFRTAFVDDAASSLRADIALRAMLGLARQIGLGTLGSASRPRHNTAIANLFDYTPVSAAHPEFPEPATARSKGNPASYLLVQR